MTTDSTTNEILRYLENGMQEQAIRALENIDVNVVLSDGDTLLHKAVAKGQVAMATRLLLKGADFRKTNTSGQIALSEAYAGAEALHRIRQVYHRATEAVLSGTWVNPEVQEVVKKMRRDGIVKVEGLLQGDQLRQVQADIDRLVRKMKWGRLTGGSKYKHYDQREYWQPKHKSYVFNDPLKDSEALVAFCELPFLREAADAYLGKKSHIKRVMGMRYLPTGESLEKQQFGWHHDMEDTQFKVMVLLTDIGQEDQYMAFVPGTHVHAFDYEHFLTNKITYEDCGIDPLTAPEIHTLGKAGDVYFFDSNGMHRGTRSPGRLRDALFIEYTGDKNWKNIWGTDMPAERRDRIMQEKGHDLLKQYVSVTPKWKRARETQERKRPTWAESLNEPELWV